MKKIQLLLQITILSVLISFQASAQDLTPSPGPYWVVESNIKTPKSSIAYFYTADHQLMHQEKIEGKRMNIKRRKVKKGLDNALTQVNKTWAIKGKIDNGERFLANRF